MLSPTESGLVMNHEPMLTSRDKGARARHCITRTYRGCVKMSWKKFSKFSKIRENTKYTITSLSTKNWRHQTLPIIKLLRCPRMLKNVSCTKKLVIEYERSSWYASRRCKNRSDRWEPVSKQNYFKIYTRTLRYHTTTGNSTSIRDMSVNRSRWGKLLTILWWRAQKWP